MYTVPLDKNRHDRQRFQSGVKSLDNYLKVMASQQSKKDNTRTFVLENKQDTSCITGFYTLTMTTLDASGLSEKLRKKHFSSTSAGLIARMAVDTRYQGQGFGEWLLIDALHRLLAASDSVAFPVVLVDAKDGAKDFYVKYGFTPFHDEKNKLFISVADIRAGLD